MKSFIAYSLILASFSLTAAIHESDDRIDLFASNSILHHSLAKATVAMVRKSKMTNQGDYYEITSKPLEFYLPRPQCLPARFKDQISVAECSGFLVAPDIIITAGHCVNSQFSDPETNCKRYYNWVFDLKSSEDLSDQTTIIEYDPQYDYTEVTVKKNIPASSVYECKRVIDSKYTQGSPNSSYQDYAIVQLSRPVVDRTPLKIRTSGKIAENSDIIAIGHPLGLPSKIATNAWVTNNSEKYLFYSNLDVMNNNSGSAVFDASTGLVEGIIVKGIRDFHREGGCYKPFIVDDSGYSKTYRITEVPNLVELVRAAQ